MCKPTWLSTPWVFDYVGFFFVFGVVEKAFFEESHHVYYSRTCIFAHSGRWHVYLLGRWARTHRRHRGDCDFASPVSLHRIATGFRRAKIAQRDTGQSTLGEGHARLKRGAALQALIGRPLLFAVALLPTCFENSCFERRCYGSCNAAGCNRLRNALSAFWRRSWRCRVDFCYR